MSFEAQFMEDFVSGVNSFICILAYIYYAADVLKLPGNFILNYVKKNSNSCIYFLAVENPGSDNLKSSMVIPPPSVLDRVLKDLFREGTFFHFTKHFDVL